ncbi:MAG: type I 3-dehydroquinate dehydratase [Candidatus Electrothrix aestuarii]|uniref:3-dehydroquinate dehydratase n=1 Tax=Candidatus Electrothrix aestuarii TaxID=3062594 RepID=A0AAU8LXH0_9BACT|nr:type I 3-dehydroquinate dehydratase [Candidatus Electrothrix aestuarii]WPD22944.1 MAG: type I 3-dehydroquinate dehydratase [Candidatus Electrothrix sp. GW3-3]
MKNGKICVSLAGGDVAALVEQARQAGDRADVIEVRLDSMLRPDVAGCCVALDKPLLFTYRPLWEGGAFEGSEERRILPLLEAVRRDAAYVDFELRANRRLRKRLLAGMELSSTQMIISWHNFDNTPSQAELEQVLVEMMESGAHIGKLVTTAHCMEDALRVLRLQEQAKEADFPLSCFCMGTPGRISRLATLYLGGYMTYACLNDAQATAPGQLSLEKLKALTSLLA